MSEEKTKKRKSNLKLGKETYGDIPIEECFKKAFEPYFPGIKVKKTDDKEKK